MNLRTLLTRIAAIAAPIALVFASVVLVDPYNYFNVGHLVPDATKKKTLYHSAKAMAFSNTMWHLVSFKRHPTDHVLLGDSRLSRFDTLHMDEISGVRYKNFGVPGGNYQSLTDLFNYTDSVTTLKEVVVQVSFRGLMEGSNWDLYSEPRVLMDSPLLYLSNRRVLQATWLNAKATVAPGSVTYDKLPPDHWRKVIEMTRDMAAHFTVDSSNFDRLQAIADRCRQIHANLTFVVYPVHHDIHQVYDETGLTPLRKQFIARVASIGPVLDLEAIRDFPQDTTHWRDPIHLTVQSQRIVADLIHDYQVQRDGSAYGAGGTRSGTQRP